MRKPQTHVLLISQRQNHINQQPQAQTVHLHLKEHFPPQSVFVSVFWRVVCFVFSSHWQNTLTGWLFHHKKRIRWNLTGVKATELLDFAPVIAKLETLWNLKSQIVQNIPHKHSNLCLTGSEMAVLHTQASKASNKALSFSNNQQCNYKEENKDLNIPVYVCIYVTSFSSSSNSVKTCHVVKASEINKGGKPIADH